MRSFEIENTRAFMNALLATETFAAFTLSSATVSTFVTFTVDGTLHRDFFDSDQVHAADPSHVDLSPEQPPQTAAAAFVPWTLVRPQLYDLVKGKRAPLSMKLVLRLDQPHTDALAQGTSLPVSPKEISGLFLNIQYAKGKVTCVTGTSLAVFTTDKSLDHLWDEYVEAFLKENQIPFT